MFDKFVIVAEEIRSEILEIYWILLVPLVLLLIILEFFKESKEAINVFDIFRRVIISMVMLFTFDYVINIIGMTGDGIIDKIDKSSNFWDALTSLVPNTKGLSAGLFDLRGHILYVFSLLSYIIAYLGFFVAEALTHFVWVVLFTISPLMILAYIPKATANVTKNLYKGLIKVVIWKCLWTILGALLLELAMNPQFSTMEDYIFAISVNLCIGLSMLFIPFAVRSLINDGLESAASALASAPAVAMSTGAKLYITKLMKQSGLQALAAGQFAVKPLTNPINARMTRLREKIGPKIKKAKEEYTDIHTEGWRARKKAEKIYRAYGLIYDKESEDPNEGDGKGVTASVNVKKTEVKGSPLREYTERHSPRWKERRKDQ